MEFNGKVTGTLQSFGTRATSGKGVNVSKALVSITMNPDELEEAMGQEMRELVFSSFRTIDDVVVCGYDKLKPQGTWEIHSIKFHKHAWRGVQPKIKGITPVKETEAVVINLELPLILEDGDELAGELHHKVKKTIKFQLDPSQQRLPLGEGGSAAVVKDGPFGNPEHVVQ